jgi:hypothetical protein
MANIRILDGLEELNRFLIHGRNSLDNHLVLAGDKRGK